MRKHRARVYYRSYLHGEPHPPVRTHGVGAEVEDRWRDEASMDFAHDSHSKWEMLTVAEPTEATVQATLERKHPKRFLIVDKISWLEDGEDD